MERGGPGKEEALETTKLVEEAEEKRREEKRGKNEGKQRQTDPAKIGAGRSEFASRSRDLPRATEQFRGPRTSEVGSRSAQPKLQASSS